MGDEVASERPNKIALLRLQGRTTQEMRRKSADFRSAVYPTVIKKDS